VVVGTGAGGGPAAALLAERGLDVVMLESGSHLTAADFTGVEGELFFRLGRFGATGDGSLNLYAGHCVGGSTVVNDALCFPTPPDVLEAWRRDFGLAGLGDAAFASEVAQVWRDVHAEATDAPHRNRNARQLALGAVRLGWATEWVPRNVRGCINLGLCNLGCPSGAKQSTLLTCVPRAEAAGARVLDRVRAERVELRAGAVRAVHAVRLAEDGRSPVARLRVETPRVCAAAGVLGTPALLLRSGLGGGSSRLGRGLQVHTSVSVAARFREPVHGYYGPTMAFAISEFADVNGRGGPGFMLESTTVSPVPTASSLPGFGPEHERAMRALPHLARALVVLRDRSRGSLDVDGAGRARFHLTPGPEDLERLRAGIRALGRAYLAADAEEVFLPLNGFPAVRSESDLSALDDVALDPRRVSLLYAVHLFGAAAMGGGPDAPCDETGAVRGARGLFVCDASSLPSNTGVNPQITIMANALRIARGIAEAA
jgi:choline dehydrogenase-like flavoprotein